MGGKIESEESVNQASIREIKEECGVDISAEDIKHLSSHYSETYELHILVSYIEQDLFNEITTMEEEPIFKKQVHDVFQHALDFLLSL